MRRELRDRRVVVEATDQHGQLVVFPSAKVMMAYDSGEQLGQRSGYTIDISGKRVANRINRFSLPVTGGDADGDQSGTSGDGGDPDPGGGGNTSSSNDCCITVQTTMLSAPPQLMNNAANLRNKLYRVQDGSVWIIDHVGNAMKISNAKATEQLDGPSTGSQSIYTLDYPISHTPDDHTAMIVVRSGVVQTYVATGTAFSGFNQYKLNNGDIELSLGLSNGESALVHYI
jgi:hypothetical protein